MCPAPANPTHAHADATVLPDWTGELVSCLSFSPDGQLLAVGGGNGSVRVWQVQAATNGSGGPTLAAVGSSAVPVAAAAGSANSAPAGVGAVRWLPTADGEGWVLLTGNRNNSSLQLWHTPSPGGEWALLQTLRFEGKDGQQEFFIHVDLVASQQLVVLADTARKAVYTLHYSGELRCWAAGLAGLAGPCPALSCTALHCTAVCAICLWCSPDLPCFLGEQQRPLPQTWGSRPPLPRPADIALDGKES